MALVLFVMALSLLSVESVGQRPLSLLMTRRRKRIRTFRM